jgi:hypothetical protein
MSLWYGSSVVSTVINQPFQHLNRREEQQSANDGDHRARVQALGIAAAQRTLDRPLGLWMILNGDATHLTFAPHA